MNTVEKQETSSKITKKDMIQAIKNELVIYFREGRLNPTSFFEFGDVKFSNIYDILKIHFILTQEVNEYVLGLEKNIRNIKSSTRLEKEIYRGQIRGSIDWNMTIKYRLNTIYKDKTKFACDNVDKFYNTKENAVLKSAIMTIYNIIYEGLGMERFNNQLWYKNGEKLSQIILDMNKSNIYIRKIDISKVTISDKMISDVSKNRNKIYRDSAKIIKLYRDIMNLKKEQIDNLFTNTFIEMKNESEVFELYCIIKYLRNNFPKESIRYNLVDGNEDCLAKFEDLNYNYTIYHNREGVNYLKFQIDISEVENNENIFLKKKIKSLEKKFEIYSILENKSISDVFWKGRPDLIILKINKNNDKIEEIEIGEVKYTNNRSYMYKGLEELLEYKHFIKYQNSNYIDNVRIKGILFVDNIDLTECDFDDVRIINRKGNIG